MKKKKQSKRDRLTVKQSKLLQALPTSDSVAEAGERAATTIGKPRTGP